MKTTNYRVVTDGPNDWIVLDDRGVRVFRGTVFGCMTYVKRAQA